MLGHRNMLKHQKGNTKKRVYANALTKKSDIVDLTALSLTPLKSPIPEIVGLGAIWLNR